ncbi:PQQ-dependent sugar dehydrogenase [Pontibacter rugosus]|uniref:PQQ-dependent sugar dehydrogenase n=2 Tax=Pontibacter rugosus TaxID=1745966 RepID=A0ABW3STP7_9BACT
MAQPPSGFVVEPIGGEWNTAVGLTFSKDGKRMYVWEKGGKVWIVEDGERHEKPLLDLTDEVGDWGDHGLLGFTLDPNFNQNGFIYLLYVVDRNHLMNFGKGGYNPTAISQNEATIGRVTRYTVDLQNGGSSVKASSRKILLGETAATGIPILYVSHGIGSISFGEDGSLLISAGDGATAGALDSGFDPNNPNDSYTPQALADGIISKKEDVGAFRSQQVESYNGKILRIDPATGNGLPSNPFYDARNPKSAASKVWALGLRNPFRFTIRPGTGSGSFPGIIYVGDVGWMDWEEINVVDKPGMNFGWPLYEGLEKQQFYYGRGTETMNPFAPNPLYTAEAGANPYCKPFFTFESLLKQPLKSSDPVFMNPCDNTTPIAAKYTFVHARPALDWVNNIIRDGKIPDAITRTGIFKGEEAAVIGVGEAGSPVTGKPFYGSSSTGGIWYTGNDLPAEYRNTYFFGDYGAGWIKNASFDNANSPKAIRNFIDKEATVTAFATNPVTGGLYYIDYATKVHKIAYYGDNTPPKAVAEADKLYGASPLVVKFTGSKSTDAEGQNLTYAWDFGDGSAIATTANPTHTFTSAEIGKTYKVVLKVTDSKGLSSTKSLTITLNNTPPVVEITSPAEGTKYPFVGLPKYNLRAKVTDNEDADAKLKYEWQLVMHHNTHVHPEPVDTKHETEVTIQPIGCDGETYFYRVHLKVTDTGGLSASDFVDIYPDCSGGVVAAVALDLPEAPKYNVGASIALKVNFADSNRAWEKVEYFNGATLLGTATAAPYTFNWQNAKSGSYSITAKATDMQGHSVVSEAVQVTVGNGQVAELDDCLPGLKHYVHMDKVENGVIDDFASNATASCTDCPTETTGMFHGAMAFNGETNGVDVSDATNFNWKKDDSFTISFWTRTDATAADNMVIVGRNATESSMHWWIGMTPEGYANFNLLDKNHIGTAVGGKGPKINDGQWHYIVVVRDEATNQNFLYVDGVEVEKKTHNYESSFESPVALNIGYLKLNHGYHYKGDVDEVKLYDRALDVSAISGTYNAGAGNYCGLTPLGITDNKTFAGVYEVYPNPTPSSQINVFVSELQPAETVTLKLLDITGKVVLEQQATAKPDGTLSLSLQPKQFISTGLYNLLLTSKERTLNRKVIVQ